MDKQTLTVCRAGKREVVTSRIRLRDLSHTHLPMLCSVSAYPTKSYHRAIQDSTFIQFCALSTERKGMNTKRNDTFYET